MFCRLLGEKPGGSNSADDAEQEYHRKDIDVGQQVAQQHQCRRDRDLMGVGHDQSDDRDERDDLP